MFYFHLNEIYVTLKLARTEITKMVKCEFRNMKVKK